MISEKLIDTLASQASEAVAAGKTVEAGQLMGDATEGQLMTGGVMSWTTMVREQEAELPQSSVAT